MPKSSRKEEREEKSYKCLFLTPECEVRYGTLIVELIEHKFEFKSESEFEPEVNKNKNSKAKITFEESFTSFETEYVVCPGFLNAHTHLGDSVAKDPPFSGIELVTKNGYKFKMLEKYSKEIIDAMKSSIELAISSGVVEIIDFRESGISGVEMLRKADKRGVCKALGRPLKCNSDVEELLKLSDGIGISSVRDVGYNLASELREKAKKAGKLFAVHAGEVDDEDVDSAIELKPDFIVHMNMANKRQIKALMDENINLVSCFRSNAFFGVFNLDNYRMFTEYENWFIGTDNVMLSSPSILEEMHFASYLLRDKKADEALFKAATKGEGVVIFHKKMNLSFLRNPISSIVRRAEIADVKEVFFGKIRLK